MVKYTKCGHETKGLIVGDGNPSSLASYMRWSESVGINGTKEECYDCWWERREKEFVNNFK